MARPIGTVYTVYSVYSQARACPVDMRWNAATNTCIPSCAPGDYWDVNSQRCKTPVQAPVWHPCGPGMHWDEARQTCVYDIQESTPQVVNTTAPSETTPKPVNAGTPKCPNGVFPDPRTGECPPDAPREATSVPVKTGGRQVNDVVPGTPVAPVAPAASSSIPTSYLVGGLIALAAVGGLVAYRFSTSKQGKK